MTQPQPPMQLEYDSAAAAEPAGRRPRWVWAFVILYGALAGAIVLLPAWTLLFTQEPGMLVLASVTATILSLCGVGLVMTPVRGKLRRPITRRNVWIPIVATGCLMAGLVVGAGIALQE